ncbi:MAG: hypothetical protein WD069_22690 [Planctomycetales bacterium]
MVDELKANRQSGQPWIDEEEFPTGRLRVNVIWDDWEQIPLEERTSTVVRAFEKAEGKQYAERIALASGLTVPEAHAAGMLPYEVVTALRKSDPLTLEDCRNAMIEEGASVLLDPERPQLRFATEEEAEAAVKRLSEKLPGSEQVWLVTKDVGMVPEWTSL